MSKLRQKMQDQMALRGFSIRTHQAYTGWIEQLTRFHHISPDLLTDDQIQEFMLYLIQKRKLTPSTCRQAIHSIRYFYANVVGREVSRFALPGLKSPSKVPDLLSRKEVFAIIEACTNPKYRTMMLVGYETGLRLSEITHLRVSDIHSDRQVLRVEQGKGNKDRYVLLNESLLRMLRNYWQMYRPHEPLFYGRDINEPITNGSLQKAFRRSLRKSGISKKVGVHGLRHYSESRIIPSCVD